MQASSIRKRDLSRGIRSFHVLVTTLGHNPVPSWRLYNSRTESENSIKELKQDFGADGFCSFLSGLRRARWPVIS